MKGIRLSVTDAMYHALVETAASQGNSVGPGKGVAPIIRLAIHRHLNKLGYPAELLNITDAQWQSEIQTQA